MSCSAHRWGLSFLATCSRQANGSMEAAFRRQPRSPPTGSLAQKYTGKRGGGHMGSLGLIDTQGPVVPGSPFDRSHRNRHLALHDVSIQVHGTMAYF
ncbi:hypothetical protein GQ53DRAFT_375991 [Thozetella sp. PMI_491]|nr:hypothetical protein GQ53DRAFT_375991 [Thozetella sp. PMI_491]